MPARSGESTLACRRFRRLAQKDVCEKLFGALKAPDLDWGMSDSTILRVHQQPAGQKEVPRYGTPGPESRRGKHQNPRLPRRAGQRRGGPAGDSPQALAWPLRQNAG